MIQSIISVCMMFALSALASPASAQQPTDAQVSAVRSACRGDYRSVCADVPTGGKAALQCLQQHASSVSQGCQAALAPLAGPTTTAPAAPSAAPASSAPPVASPAPAANPPAAASPPAAPSSPAPEMTPRQQARLLRTDCSNDFQKYCSSVQLGGGRAVACLKEHASDLSQLCQSALLAAKKP
jgi:hypothetical protein